MPLYVYECSATGKRFEHRQGIHEEPLAACPACGAAARRIIVPGAAVHVRGRSGDEGARVGRAPSPGCGRGTPCCGREAPCAVKPCDRE